MGTMSTEWRLVDSGHVRAADSAAIDEAILESRASGAVPDTLHFYVRASPTVSLGHFQRLSESVDLDRCRDAGVDLVRRKSGGSSIFTGPGQLIYGLIISGSQLPRGPEASFAVICSAIARAISSLGVDARHRPVNDIEVDGKKVSGSAQLRRRGVVLQHGSVILDTDLGLMDSVLRKGSPSERVTSLRSVLGRPPSMKVLKSALKHELSIEFGADIVPGKLTPDEEVRAAQLAEEFYANPSWTSRF
jgi:lipoate-protein ligase A